MDVKIKHILCGILLLGLSSCEERRSVNEPEVYRPKTIEAFKEEPIMLQQSDILQYQGYEASIQNIEDSRCPKDTECYWQGFLLLDLHVTNSNGEDQMFEFYFLAAPELNVTHRLKGEEEWQEGGVAFGDAFLSFTALDPAENEIGISLQDYIFTAFLK